jgi:hypothetical protein
MLDNLLRFSLLRNKSVLRPRQAEMLSQRRALVSSGTSLLGTIVRCKRTGLFPYRLRPYKQAVRVMR